MSEGEETIEIEAQDLEPGQWTRYKRSAFSEVSEWFKVESIEPWELAPDQYVVLKVKDRGGDTYERFFHRIDTVEVRKRYPHGYPRVRIEWIEEEPPSVGE